MPICELEKIVTNMAFTNASASSNNEENSYGLKLKLQR